MIYAIKAQGLNRVKLGFSKDEYTFVWRFQAVDIVNRLQNMLRKYSIQLVVNPTGFNAQ